MTTSNYNHNDSRNGSVYGGFKTVLVKIIGENFNKLIVYCNFVANSLIRLDEMPKKLY